MNFKKQWTYTGLVLIVSMIVGALSGAITGLVTSSAIDDYIREMSDQDVTLSLSQVKPDPVPGTYEEALSAVRESHSSFGYMYRNSLSGTEVSERLYTDDLVAVGVVVTSDGWVLFESEVASLVDSDDMRVSIDGEWYQPIEVIQDSRSNTVLVHIDASGLDVATFGSSESARSGDMIFVVKNNDALFVSSLVDVGVGSEVLARAEDHVGYWTLQDEFGGSLPILDSSGHVIGLTTEGVDAMPLYGVEDFIDSVLQFGEPVYSAIGAYGLDINSIVNLSEQSLESSHGFMILPPNSYTQAIVKNSPAELAGLQKNDLIVSVGGTEISEEVSLAIILERYDIDQEVVLGVVREGVLMEVVVILGDYNLLY